MWETNNVYGLENSFVSQKHRKCHNSFKRATQNMAALLTGHILSGFGGTATKSVYFLVMLSCFTILTGQLQQTQSGDINALNYSFLTN